MITINLKKGLSSEIITILPLLGSSGSSAVPSGTNRRLFQTPSSGTNHSLSLSSGHYGNHKHKIKNYEGAHDEIVGPCE